MLGQAYVEVHADLRPFIRDLDRQLRAAAEAFESRLGRALANTRAGAGRDGEQLGEELGEGMDRGMRRRLGDSNRSPWVVISAALASSLDDGISALPQEVKAGIATALLAVTPLLAGGIAGAVSAGIGAGVAGLGTLLAFQYTEVQQRGEQVATNLQQLFINAASPFAPVVLDALDMIESRFRRMAPALTRMFSTSANFVQPLTRSLLDFVDRIVLAFNSSGEQIQGFVGAAADGITMLGQAAGIFIETLADTGETGQEAFRDMVELISVTVVTLGNAIALLTELWGVTKQIVDVFVRARDILQPTYDESTIMVTRLGTASRDTANAIAEVVARTKEEEEELKRLDKALKGARDATYGLIDSQIDLERSFDEISAAIKENGATLDITNEKGRRNTEEFLTGLKAAEEATLKNVATGKMSSQEAARYYDDQIAKIRELATSAGITGAQFDLLFGDIIRVAQTKMDANAMGITDTERELRGAVDEAGRLLGYLEQVSRFRLPAVGTRRFSEYAEGGIVHGPTQALIGEAGPEVVIPLTKPQRAAQLMQQSGLASMLAGPMSMVNVYVGNEQLDARTYRIMEGNNVALSNSVAYGARGL